MCCKNYFECGSNKKELPKPHPKWPIFLFNEPLCRWLIKSHKLLELHLPRIHRRLRCKLLPKRKLFPKSAATIPVLAVVVGNIRSRSEEHTSELQSQFHLL